MKRTELKRGGPLKANPDKAREWQQRSRRRLPDKSPKMRAAKSDRDIVRAQVFERDDNMCFMLDLDRDHHCSRDLTVHHLRKSGQGGAYAADNLVTLCAKANTWVEDFPDKAYALGLVVRYGEPSTLPRLLALRETSPFGDMGALSPYADI